MTAVAHGTRQPSRSLLGKTFDTVGRSVRARRRVSALAALVREHVTTVVAFGSFDFGMFQVWRPAGWIVLAPLLLVLEWKVRD